VCVATFFEKLPPTVVAIEACGASHHWARLLTSFGHEVKLIAAQLVKPYVKRGKNGAADAEALCEAMSRPTMRFVPVKTADQQAVLMLMGVRDRLIRNQTQLSNAIRGFAAEFGLTAARVSIIWVDCLISCKSTTAFLHWLANCSRPTRGNISSFRQKSRTSMPSWQPGRKLSQTAIAWRRSQAEVIATDAL
jgi:hypothetical protein